MPQRYRQLRNALRTLRTPNSDGAVPQAPSGSILRNFQEVISGERVVSYTRSEASRQGSIEQISVFPFYAGGLANTEVLVGISRRANEETRVSGVRTACNHQAPDLDTHDVINNFQPAKAVVSIAGATSTERTSQITGERYQDDNSESYTLPYGATASEQFEGVVRATILVAVNGINNASVSFRPERR